MIILASFTLNLKAIAIHCKHKDIHYHFTTIIVISIGNQLFCTQGQDIISGLFFFNQMKLGSEVQLPFEHITPSPGKNKTKKQGLTLETLALSCSQWLLSTSSSNVRAFLFSDEGLMLKLSTVPHFSWLLAYYNQLSVNKIQFYTFSTMETLVFYYFKHNICLK